MQYILSFLNLTSFEYLWHNNQIPISKNDKYNYCNISIFLHTMKLVNYEKQVFCMMKRQLYYIYVQSSQRVNPNLRNNYCQS